MPTAPRQRYLLNPGFHFVFTLHILAGRRLLLGFWISELYNSIFKMNELIQKTHLLKISCYFLNYFLDIPTSEFIEDIFSRKMKNILHWINFADGNGGIYFAWTLWWKLFWSANKSWIPDADMIDFLEAWEALRSLNDLLRIF